MNAILIVLAGVSLSAQSIPRDEIRSRTTPYAPPPRVVLRAEVHMVDVPVVVRDDRGHVVSGLTRADFEIHDEGKKRDITSFSEQTLAHQGVPAGEQPKAPPPRFLALCFDDLHLTPGDLGPVKVAAQRFVKNSLAPGDRAAVVTTSQSNKSAFVGDQAVLAEEIAKITAPSRALSSDSQRCIEIAPHEADLIVNGADPGGQLLHRKVDECSACSHLPCHEGEITGVANVIWQRARNGTASALRLIDQLVDGMSQFPGQRMILLSSAGFLTDTLQADIDQVIDKARRVGIVINVLDARGVHLNLSSGSAYDGVGMLASGTGGIYYHNQNDLEKAFRELSVVPETMYVLGFAPPAAADGKFHKLKVQLPRGKRYSVQARAGYSNTAAIDPTSVSPESKLNTEVAAKDAIADLPATFTWEQWAGTPGITLLAHLDLTRLGFKPFQDRRTQKLSIIAVLFDSSGAFIAGKRSELEFSFKDATFEQLSKTGFTAALTLNAPAGKYSVRAVAQDAFEGKLAAMSSAIEIK